MSHKRAILLKAFERDCPEPYEKYKMLLGEKNKILDPL